jgi:hypothetical protein
MPIDRDFLHEYAKNPQMQQAARPSGVTARQVCIFTPIVLSLMYPESNTLPKQHTQAPWAILDP